MKKSMENYDILLVTHNQHKADEINQCLSDKWSINTLQSLGLRFTWDETGSSFLDNARIKINAAKASFDGWILADDSGLCVEALKGEPGVRSSSFGGVEGDHRRNNERLLYDLTNVDNRKAYFICTLVLFHHKLGERIFEGRVEGRILKHLSGNHGFGYDPLFFVETMGKTMAEMTMAEKNAISHRARAVEKLVLFLNEFKLNLLG